MDATARRGSGLARVNVIVDVNVDAGRAVCSGALAVLR